MGQTVSWITDGGCWKVSIGVPVKKVSIKFLQIGAAPRDPAILSIGELSLLPTQTPTTRLGVYPIVSASRKSSVVPVFTAAGLEMVSALPNSSALVLLSERIEDMIKAVPSVILLLYFC